jgi:plasmid maintenance system killer protein
MRIYKTSQHGNKTIIEGNKKNILEQLRTEAREKRSSSRIAHKLEDTVHSIDENKHPSKLVTMASFRLEELAINQLLKLLNNHGITNYAIA